MKANSSKLENIQSDIKELKKQKGEVYLKEKYEMELRYLKEPAYNRTWFRLIALIILGVTSSRLVSAGVVNIQFTQTFFYVLMLFNIFMCIYFLFGVSKSKFGRIIQLVFGVLILFFRIFLSVKILIST